MLRKGMDDLFKQNLLRMRQPQNPTTFSEALFGHVHWVQKSAFNAPPAKTTAAQFTEKAQVMESLERYAQEKLGENKLTSIKIEGGEIAFKPDPTWDGIPQYSGFYDLRMDLSIEEEALELCLKNKEPGKVRILFVAESFRPAGEFEAELKDGFLNQLLPAFPLKTAELFGRMLSAMKLIDEEVIIYPTLSGERDLSSEVMKVVGYYRPEIIVTLGANSTHKILKGQERLAQVHGQFFNRKIENIGTFAVVPLFHPSIIENNQNMKKTAWADMQKIMQFLKKL